MGSRHPRPRLPIDRFELRTQSSFTFCKFSVSLCRDSRRPAPRFRLGRLGLGSLAPQCQSVRTHSPCASPSNLAGSSSVGVKQGSRPRSGRRSQAHRLPPGSGAAYAAAARQCPASSPTGPTRRSRNLHASASTPRRARRALKRRPRTTNSSSARTTPTPP